MVPVVTGPFCSLPSDRIWDGGFAIGLVDGLTAAEPVPHTVIHVVPRRAGDRVVLPACSEWITDAGVLA